MRCDFELNDKLPEYIKEVLPQAETQRIEAHLAECAECAQEVEQIRLLFPELQEYSGKHVPAEVLVDYMHFGTEAFGQAKDSEWNEGRFKEHLEICEQCASELETLHSLEKDFKPSPSRSIKESEIASKFSLNIKKVLAPPRFKFALAAAVILLIAIPVVNNLFRSQIQMSPLPQVVWVEIDQYPSSLFEGEMVTRGAETEPAAIFHDPQEAALDQFIKSVRIVEGKITTIGDETTLAEPSRMVLLQLRTQDRETSKNFAAFIPLTLPESSQSTELQAWLMAIPSRVLYRVDLGTDSVMTFWDSDLGSQVCVLFTYRTGKEYRALPPACTELVKRD